MTTTAPGYTTASMGTVSTSGQTVTVSGLNRAGGQKLTITYGSKAGGGAGATAGMTLGAQTWQAQERSAPGGTLTDLASSPVITIVAPDGSGTIAPSPSAVSAGASGRTITLTYKATGGPLSGGVVRVSVPSGWSAPSPPPPPPPGTRARTRARSPPPGSRSPSPT